MSNTHSFEAAAAPDTYPDIYDSLFVETVPDAKCADFVEGLAVFIPHNPTRNIVPDHLRDFCLEMEGVSPTEDMGAEFAAAFEPLRKVAMDATSLDGNKNVCLAIGAQDKLLDGLIAFNKAQDVLRLTSTGKRHFEDRIRARQIYWDMAGHGVASVTMPNPTGYR